ncbi:MAG TPA: response regulator [Candidatus Binatia bacterium]|nr:response regulator [Candidatus Binatia bacterium]
MSAHKTKKRILVVEDDSAIQELYCNLLREAGYEVEGAEHALAAVCAVVRATPDLILADIRMPIIDGRDLVRELKSHSDSQHIPVVAITGHDSPEMRESALQAGYADYITKPIDPRRFPEQIAELLRRHQPAR